MPKLWSDTIAEHRHAMRKEILDAAWALVGEHGLLSVTMSQIAEKAGVGRATLYRYFPDVEAILVAWHERQTDEHLNTLAALATRAGEADVRLREVLAAYALICHHRGGHGGDVVALLHRAPHMGGSEQRLIGLLGDLLRGAAAEGHVRDDIPPDELAGYCVHALAAGGTLPSKAAVHRLVHVTLTGLLPAT